MARGDSERAVENLAKLIEDTSTLAMVGVREQAIAVSFHLDPRADQVLVDRSRNRSKPYCDARTCGNRLHVAAYRERQRAAGA